MSRVERYQAPGGPVVELRYATLLDGAEVLDEIVAPWVHVEMLSHETCWADIGGVRATWHAVKRGSLRFLAEPDSAERLP